MASNSEIQVQPSADQLDGGVQGVANSEGTDTGGSTSPREEQKATSRNNADAVESLRIYFTTEVSTAHADILMLTCCLISGLVDSTIYNAYGTFVSMQTGTHSTHYIHQLHRLAVYKV